MSAGFFRYSKFTVYYSEVYQLVNQLVHQLVLSSLAKVTFKVIILGENVIFEIVTYLQNVFI
jgi:hypothetical protein